VGLVEVDPRLAHVRCRFFYKKCKGTIISEGVTCYLMGETYA